MTLAVGGVENSNKHTYTHTPSNFLCFFVFSQNSFSNAIRVSNSLDPDQDRHSVGPDLGPDCLQRL